MKRSWHGVEKGQINAWETNIHLSYIVGSLKVIVFFGSVNALGTPLLMGKKHVK